MIPALLLYASLVNDVRTLIDAHNLPAAERKIRAYQQQAGNTPEVAAAFSWMARGAFDGGNFDQADAYATETRKVSDALLHTRSLDADRVLPIALGAAIEVHGGVLAQRGERPEALAYLREQLKAFAATSIAERIRKNINLLNLEGKPAPALVETEWLGSRPPALASLRGHPVLLFFWAHWCGDCKGEVPILADVQKKFASRGLVLIAPTKLYGYTAGAPDAAPAVEKQYIEEVRKRFYGALLDMPVPLSAANFLTYGASTTPTLVLIDSAGTVRYYHPSAVAEAELTARVEDLLK